MTANQAPLLDLSIGRYVSAGATFDEPKRVYRYVLWREWEASPARVLWIMLNPSTADENVLDPTLRRVEGFSRAWGFGGFLVCNLFALRATNPAALRTHSAPIGETVDGFNINDDEIRTQGDRADAIVLAWGSHRTVPTRAESVERLLTGRRVICLGRNADGQPKHPLYLPASVERWSSVLA